MTPLRWTAAFLLLGGLAACGNRTGPTARELNGLIVHPDVGFTVKAADASAPEPAADSAIRALQSEGCTKDAGKADAVTCRFSLTLFDPTLPDDAGLRYRGSGQFIRKGGQWRALQNDYVLEAAGATPRPSGDSGG